MGESAAVLRTRMVNNQLRTFDVTDHRIQDAMLEVERERFVPAASKPIAYSDQAITIATDDFGRPTRAMTLPAVLGRLLQLANPKSDELVLLVGAGLGYSAAIMEKLADSVIALESDEALADGASATLDYVGATNAVVVTGPLPEGYPSEAPFDLIFLDGAIEVEPTTLLSQLREGGRLVTVDGAGLSGRARIYWRGTDGISSRTAFNASVDLLPGFAKAPTFVF